MNKWECKYQGNGLFYLKEKTYGLVAIIDVRKNYFCTINGPECFGFFEDCIISAISAYYYEYDMQAYNNFRKELNGDISSWITENVKFC